MHLHCGTLGAPRTYARQPDGGRRVGPPVSYRLFGCAQVLSLLQGELELDVKVIDVLGADSDKKLKQMRTFSGGRNTVPQVIASDSVVDEIGCSTLGS